MNLRRKINERAIPLEDFPDTYLSGRKKEVQAERDINFHCCLKQ